MLSIAVLTHQAPAHTADCLSSLLSSIRKLGLEGRCEFVLVDDCSDESTCLIELLRQARGVPGADVRIFRFKKHCNYAYGVAFIQSVARGDSVLFFSHDMIVPPACLEVLLDERFARDPRIGILRCRSQHMDMAAPLELSPAKEPKGFADVAEFSQQVAREFGVRFAEPHLLIGDSMMFKRAVIEKIGVFDTRFFGLLADVDYGLRAQRAGFKHVVPLGAWLAHGGSAAANEILARGGADPARHIYESWKTFRAKWDPSLPDDWISTPQERVRELVKTNRLNSPEYQPMLAIDPEIVEVL